MLLCIIALVAPSQTVTVSNISALRAAISNAADGTTILLEPGNYMLSPGGQLEIDNNLHVNVTALEAGTVTLDAGGASRVLSITGGSEVVLSGLTITNGRAGSGGGIFVSSTATITDCNIHGNNADLHGGGITVGITVGINVGGTATITNCKIHGNTANNNGGGIVVWDGTATITNCSVHGNTASEGGGIFALDATATITNCDIQGNSATLPGYNGGGIAVWTGATADITNCNIHDNTATLGGGIAVRDAITATITNCNIHSNSAIDKGGGIYVIRSTTTLISCTVYANTAPGGGSSVYASDDGTGSTCCTYYTSLMGTSNGVPSVSCPPSPPAIPPAMPPPAPPAAPPRPPVMYCVRAGRDCGSQRRGYPALAYDCRSKCCEAKPGSNCVGLYESVGVSIQRAD